MTRDTAIEPSFFRDVSPARYNLLKFRASSLRSAQVQMADHILLEGAGITVHSAPTGTGKSLAYLLPALETGHKAVVLTATKALQDQLLTDFQPLICDVRGAQNFRCVDFPATNCSVGGRLGCNHRQMDLRRVCPYMEQFSRAMNHTIVTTNYAMWFSMINGDKELPAEYLIADEAHLLVDLLTDVSSARFDKEDFARLGMESKFERTQEWKIENWKAWAKSPELKTSLANVFSRARKKQDARLVEWATGLERMLIALHCMPSEPVEHVIDWNSDYQITIAPVWPRDAFRRYFRAPSIVLASATITRDICSFIGLKPGQYKYWEYENGFPPELAPVYFYNKPVLSYRTTISEWLELMRQVIAIAGLYPGKRGVVFTGSYHRSQVLEEAVRMHDRSGRQWFFHQDSKGLQAALSDFRTTPGSILVSPSIAQGYDFPDDLCEFVVVVKCPYPDIRSKVVAARMSKATYMDASMVLTLIQVCGRGVRHSSDRCDCHVLDGAALRVYMSRPGLFPAWFRNRIRLR